MDFEEGMNLRKHLTLAVGLLSLTALAHAAESNDQDNEIFFTVGYYRIQTNYNPGFTLGTGGRGIGYGRVLTPALEVSARLGFSASGASNAAPGVVRVTATAGPIVNFLGDGHGNANSFYFSAGAGIDSFTIEPFTYPATQYSTGSTTSQNFAYDASIGKRFQLLPNLAWRVVVSVSGHTGLDLSNGLTSHPALDIVPFAFSVLF